MLERPSDDAGKYLLFFRKASLSGMQTALGIFLWTRPCLGLAPKPWDEGELIGTIIAVSNFEGQDKPEEDEKLVKDAGFDDYRMDVDGIKAEVVIDKGSVSEVVDIGCDEQGNLQKVSYYFRYKDKMKQKYDADPSVIKRRIIKRNKWEIKRIAKVLAERIEFNLPYLIESRGGRPKKWPEMEINTDIMVPDRIESPHQEVQNSELFQAVWEEIKQMEPRQQEIANRILEEVTDTKMIAALDVTQRMIDYVRDRLKKVVEEWRK